MGRDTGPCEKCRRKKAYVLECETCRSDGQSFAQSKGASRSECEELVQSSTAALVRYGERASRELLFGILSNKLADAMRHAYQYEFIAEGTAPGPETSRDGRVLVLEAPPVDVDAFVLAHEIASICDELVADEEICEADLAMFEYHYYDGYTYAEIGYGLGLPAGTVSGNIARVLAVIRARIEVQPPLAKRQRKVMT